MDTALDGAIRVFCERGYHATSIGELTAAMRLATGSVYKAFRDKQAVFLATIIPNPIKFGVYFRKGATSRNWDEHMAHLIEKLRERGDLDDAGYQRALTEPVVFRRTER